MGCNDTSTHTLSLLFRLDKLNCLSLSCNMCSSSLPYHPGIVDWAPVSLSLVCGSPAHRHFAFASPEHRGIITALDLQTQRSVGCRSLLEGHTAESFPTCCPPRPPRSFFSEVGLQLAGTQQGHSLPGKRICILAFQACPWLFPGLKQASVVNVALV